MCALKNLLGLKFQTGSEHFLRAPSLAEAQLLNPTVCITLSLERSAKTPGQQARRTAVRAGLLHVLTAWEHGHHEAAACGPHCPLGTTTARWLTVAWRFPVKYVGTIFLLMKTCCWKSENCSRDTWTEWPFSAWLLGPCASVLW